VGTDIDVVLFDLGGVLVRLGGVGALQELAGLESEDEVWLRWLSCEWVRNFERGRCTAEEFALGVVADWQLSTTPESFIEQFRGWPEGLYDGAIELVAAVRQRHRVGCLSNSNELHWADQSTKFGLSSVFDIAFLSHELDLIKPDRDLFEHVVSALAVEPQRVLFLDDNEANVVGARSVGITAVRVDGVDQAAIALADLGVLDR
jgi:putative hydrolase of the HAD superfamily